MEQKLYQRHGDNYLPSLVKVEILSFECSMAQMQQLHFLLLQPSAHSLITFCHIKKVPFQLKKKKKGNHNQESTRLKTKLVNNPNE